MPIVLASDGDIREKAKEYVRTHNCKCVDVGGVESPVWHEFNPDYIDIQDKGQRFVGNICKQDVWSKIEASGRLWDFSFCTHTLEDIRDPEFVIQRLRRFSLAGFIAMPHKHTELSNMDSDEYVGYGHHRWIFTVQHNVLRATAKWPITAQFSNGRNPGPGFLPWLDKSKVKNGELGILWESSFDFEYIRDDFAGQAIDGYDGILRMYRDELAGGV